MAERRACVVTHTHMTVSVRSLEHTAASRLRIGTREWFRKTKRRTKTGRLSHFLHYLNRQHNNIHFAKMTRKRWSLAILCYKYFHTSRWLLRSPQQIRQPWSRRKPEDFLPFIQNTSNRISRVLLKNIKTANVHSGNSPGCFVSSKTTGVFNSGAHMSTESPANEAQCTWDKLYIDRKKSLRNTTAVLGCTKPWIGLAEHNRLGHRVVPNPIPWPESPYEGPGWQLRKSRAATQHKPGRRILAEHIVDGPNLSL